MDLRASEGPEVYLETPHEDSNRQGGVRRETHTGGAHNKGALLLAKGQWLLNPWVETSPFRSTTSLFTNTNL